MHGETIKIIPIRRLSVALTSTLTCSFVS